MTIRIVVGDLTTFDGDVAVNAANNIGLGGGGVDGAIHRAAGPMLLEACKALPTSPGQTNQDELLRVPTGGAVPTPGFNLPSRWIIHTAGPIWPKDPNEQIPLADRGRVKGVLAGNVARANLRSCYKMPLLTAVGMGCRSIAYPAISTGVYGCPMVTCAGVALRVAHDYRDWPIEITFYLFSQDDLVTWLEMADSLDINVVD